MLVEGSHSGELTHKKHPFVIKFLKVMTDACKKLLHRYDSIVWDPVGPQTQKINTQKSKQKQKQKNLADKELKNEIKWVNAPLII